MWGLNAYCWCLKVRPVLKNASRLILEDSRFLRDFNHHGPLGNSHFGQVWSVFCVRLNVYFWCPTVSRVLKNDSM